MDDHRHTGRSILQQRLVEDRTFHETQVESVEIAAVPERQVIDDDDLVDVRSGGQAPGKVGTDEAAPPVMRTFITWILILESLSFLECSVATVAT